MTRSPIRPTDDEARAVARALVDNARFAALAFTHPETGAPFVSRIALATDGSGWPLSLMSTLALHTRAIVAQPDCALLIGEPPAKGDPLAFPRLSLAARAEPAEKSDSLRARYLAVRPKAKLYVDFADFGFFRFRPMSALLNGGFGKAYELSAADLEA